MDRVVNFSPNRCESIRNTEEDYCRALAEPMDRMDGSVYVYDDEIQFAVQVALAAGRPLLVRGDPGSGKSTLASSIARVLKYRYYEAVITSRTQARDLQWSFDAVRRLADAEARQLDSAAGLYPYIDPEVFWWAFDRDSALRRSVPTNRLIRFIAPGEIAPSSSSKEESDKAICITKPIDPGRNLTPDSASDAPAVVLLDEMDKADPDVPNDLLITLGSLNFTVKETQRQITAKKSQPPLVVITTNEERDLPPAFLRRCVQATLKLPEKKDLFIQRFVEIAKAHFGPSDALINDSQNRASLYSALAEIIFRCRSEQLQKGLRPVSTAEFLDAVKTCINLNVHPNEEGATEKKSGLWNVIQRAVLKDPRTSANEVHGQ